jgi:hypothetical protein
VLENSWLAGGGAREEDGVMASNSLAALDCSWSRGRRFAGSKVCLRSSDDTSQGRAGHQLVLRTRVVRAYEKEGWAASMQAKG